MFKHTPAGKLCIVIGWILAHLTLISTAKAQKKLKFKDIFDSSLQPNSIRDIQWMKDGKHYTTLHQTENISQIRKYNIESGSYSVLTDSKKLNPQGREHHIYIEDYEFGPREKRILIKTNVERIWRRSTKADYYIYNLKTDSLWKVNDRKSKIQFAEIGPSGRRIAYVYRNNLFVTDLSTQSEQQITHDGEENKILNGVADWVYEEEFSFAKAWYWSPDGKRIAFYHFDVRPVPEYTLPIYGGDGFNYPEYLTYRYPKAGESNAFVKIGVYDFPMDSTVWMDVGAGNKKYVVRVNWTRSPDTLAIRRMNRLQNHQDMLYADPETGRTWIARTKESETWIDENDALTFLENREQYIFVSEESGYNHLYLSSMDGDSTRQITEGDWEVTRFLGYDKQHERLYYIGTEKSPLERHLYSIKKDGSEKNRLTQSTGWHDINLGPRFNYYIHEHSASFTPPVFTLDKINGNTVRTLEKNKRLREKLQSYNLPEKEFVKLKVNEGDSLHAYMLKPADFDPDKKYPVLVYVYGGPGSQKVTRSYDGGQRKLWHNYLTHQGYIIFSMDNRGTGARGRSFEKQVYKRLGELESQDQIAAAEYLGQLSFIDKKRIGIWGWSYGGYMTSLCLGKKPEVYDVGIAVAPVTHWKFYDTIYTERFMQTPQLNTEGYRKSAPLTYAENIKADFLLVHGTADDNVHFQNSVELVNRMIKAGIDYRTLFYPDRDHSIIGDNARPHLYRQMSDFLFNNL